jgi:hypothetical protein
MAAGSKQVKRSKSHSVECEQDSNYRCHQCKFAFFFDWIQLCVEWLGNVKPSVNGNVAPYAVRDKSRPQELIFSISRHVT